MAHIPEYAQTKLQLIFSFKVSGSSDKSLGSGYPAENQSGIYSPLRSSLSGAIASTGVIFEILNSKSELRLIV